MRLSLARKVIFALPGGLPVAVVAQSEEEPAPRPLVDFTGRTECVALYGGTLEDVVIGSTDDHIRREWRGPYLSVAVREIDDPRLDGQITSHFNSDEDLIASDETPWRLRR